MSTNAIYPAVVIHHTTLADMLQAIPPLTLVYCDRYDRTKQSDHLIAHTVSKAHLLEQVRSKLVCVRAYVTETGAIHAYTPYRAQTMRHFAQDDTDLDRLWEQADAILADISAVIAQARCVYRGIIYLGPIEAVAGQRWLLSGKPEQL